MSDSLRILVYPHAMELGGCQLNAIELGAALRDRGHHVTVYAEDGPLVEYVHELGLPYIKAAKTHLRPGPAVARDLARIIREQKIDVVHGYEWPPALELYAASWRQRDVAVVSTVMSMSVSPFIPTSIPMGVSTERIRRHAASTRQGQVYLLEVPVDTVRNQPDGAGRQFRADYPEEADVLQVVIVSRLVPELKLEGILTAIRVAGQMYGERKFRLVIVGDGASRDEVEQAAAEVNNRHKQKVVLLTGSLDDPRGAYDSADICIAMGGSALRALSYGKPLIVQGEEGFFETLTPANVHMFHEQGWFGVGDNPDGAELRLTELLAQLLDDAGERQMLGDYGRELATSRFSLTRTALLQEQIYRDALANPTPPWKKLIHGTRSAFGLIRYKIRRRVERLSGRRAVDDFNARPL